MLKWFLPKGQVWRRVWILDVWSENWLFTVPYFSVRSSRYSSSYQLPSCMSPAPLVHFEITMAAINGKISWRSHGKIRDSEQSSLKTGVENDIFLSEIGSGFGEPGGTPSPRILRSYPRVSTITHFKHAQIFHNNRWYLFPFGILEILDNSFLVMLHRKQAENLFAKRDIFYPL